jgi:hypothetical protein
MSPAAPAEKKTVRREGAPHRDKTSFSLTPDAKYKLTTLKAALRRAGFSATESRIIEALIERTDARDLMKIMKVG